MATHAISYDLSQPGQNYDKLITAIKRYRAWCHVCESTWLIRTSESTKSVRDGLAEVMDSNDKLFVIDVTGKPAAWRGLPDKVSDWIKQNV